MHIKGLNSGSSDTCIFPYIEECLIPWDLVFFNEETACPFLIQTSIYPDSFPRLLGAMSQVPWDAFSWAWSPQKFPPNKTQLSTFRLWIFFKLIGVAEARSVRGYTTWYWEKRVDFGMGLRILILSCFFTSRRGHWYLPVSLHGDWRDGLAERWHWSRART